jgi:hypothetical protein
MTLFCKQKSIFANFEEVKTEPNLAESSNEMYGSKISVLAMVRRSEGSHDNLQSGKQVFGRRFETGTSQIPSRSTKN